MQAITLVFIHHEDPTPEAIFKASIWIAAGERECPDEFSNEANGWFKIVGPVESDTAEKICSSLEEFFQQNGVRVKEKMIAD